MKKYNLVKLGVAIGVTIGFIVVCLFLSWLFDTDAGSLIAGGAMGVITMHLVYDHEEFLKK